jgi:copper chaperone
LIPSGGILPRTEGGDVREEIFSYSVPAIHCGHCKRAVEDEVGTVPGVRTVEADLEAKLVTVHGDDLDDSALRAAIAEAGYEAA